MSSPSSGSVRRRFFLLAATIIALVAAFLFWKSRAKKANLQDFAQYIEAYTSGVVSKESTIRIKLADNVQTMH
jgi:alpha-2-macroglobulin